MIDKVLLQIELNHLELSYFELSYARNNFYSEKEIAALGKNFALEKAAIEKKYGKTLVELRQVLKKRN